jgi:hypothetical protein
MAAQWQRTIRDALRDQLELNETADGISCSRSLTKWSRAVPGRRKIPRRYEERLNEAELHTATDKLSFGVDLRTRRKACTIDNIRVAPSAFTNKFFVPYDGTLNGGLNGIPQVEVNTVYRSQMAAWRMIPRPMKR